MKRLSKVAALLASAALIFGAVSCSDGDSSEGSSKPTSAPEPAPAPAGTEYKWSFAAADLLANLAWSADAGQNNTTAPSGAEYAKVKLDAAGTYESTPAGLTMNLAKDSAFNKVAPSGSVSSSVTINGASAGFIEPLSDTVLSVTVKGPFTVKANVSANSQNDKTDRYAFIKVGDVEVAAAGRRAPLPAGREEAHAEVERRVVLDVGQVAGGVIDHRNLARQELGRQIGPLHDALVHDLVLVLQVEPELKRLDVLRGVEVDLLAVGAHQADAVGAVLQGEAGEAPLRGAGVERQAHALAVLIGQLQAVLHQLVPGRRRGVRIEAHLAEGVLVVVHDHRRALERDGVDAAIDIGVQHEAVDEVVDERLSLRVGGDQLVQLRHAQFQYAIQTSHAFAPFTAR